MIVSGLTGGIVMTKRVGGKGTGIVVRIGSDLVIGIVSEIGTGVGTEIGNENDSGRIETDILITTDTGITTKSMMMTMKGDGHQGATPSQGCPKRMITAPDQGRLIMGSGDVLHQSDLTDALSLHSGRKLGTGTGYVWT